MDARSWKSGMEPHVKTVHENGSWTQEIDHCDRNMMMIMKIWLKIIFGHLGHLSVKNTQRMTLSWHNHDHVCFFGTIFLCSCIDMIFVISCAFFLFHLPHLVVELWSRIKKVCWTPPPAYFFSSTPVEVKSSSQYHQNCYLTTTSLIFGQKPWINGQTWVSDTQCKTLMTFCTMSTFLISLKWLSRLNGHLIIFLVQNESKYHFNDHDCMTSMVIVVWCSCSIFSKTYGILMDSRFGIPWILQQAITVPRLKNIKKWNY